MEKIKVNMSPNPLDVQTIHASQNDTEARQWEFELHNNGELIDTSDVKEQLVFKAYKGGTEQLLPENTSTPTTTPILADIQYPDGLRTDQYFTYRETPTTVSNKARIKTIKGNTLVWNQLIKNGNFAGTSNWNASGVTQSASSNEMTVTGNSSSHNNTFSYQSLSLIANHKYFFTFEVNPNKAGGENRVLMLYYGDWKFYYNLFAENANVWTKYRTIFTAHEGSEDHIRLIAMSTEYTNKYRNIFLVDMTQMFGAGNEPTTVEEFTSLFPLPYYAYNAGTLLSFNGTGLKTTGKNFVTNFLADSTTANISWTQENGVIHSFGLSNGTTRTPTYTYAIPLKKGTYVLSGCDGGSEDTYGLRVQKSVDGAWESVLIIYDGEGTFTLDEDAEVRIAGRFSNRQAANYDVAFYPMIRYADASSDFEPYTTQTTNLPISTYFPTGMKSAGSVYDELTESKAITRIGELNIDSSTTIATWESSDGWTANITLNSYKPNGAIKSDKFEYIGSFNGASSFATSAKARGGYCIGTWQNGNRIYFYSSTASTSNDLINAIRGTNLYYELATPTETSFTTASLVTENAEIPLSNNDGTLIGKCTEQLSENPGFIDAKIKLTDSDGTCYSNKLQLHVERSPQ